MASSSSKLTLQEALDGIFASVDEDNSCDSDSEEEEDAMEPCERVSVLFVDDNDNVKICAARPLLMNLKFHKRKLLKRKLLKLLIRHQIQVKMVNKMNYKEALTLMTILGE